MQKLLLFVLLATILLVANSIISPTSFLTGSSTGNTVPDIAFVSTDPYTQSDDYRSGSLAGQTLIYIKASGLPADITLNTVFVGGVSCPIEPIYTSTLQVACYTPSSKTFGTKEVALYVGSNKATCSAAVCYFNYVTSKTPIFQYIVPNTMNPNSIVNFGGVWKVQDGYLLQINLNQYVCDSVSIGHQLLDPNDVDFIKCGTGPLDAGQYMANANVFLMGNALQLNTAYNSRDSSGTFYNFTILPQIDSLSSNQGTTAGEVLTIIGSGFSNQPTDMEVYFGNTSCIVMSSVYNSIQCHLIKPAVIDQVGIMPGHPGLKLRTFSAFSSLAVLQLSSDFTQGGGAKSQVLSAETPYGQGTGFSESMEGFFKAPSTGSYTFMLSSGGPSQLYVAESPLTNDSLVLAAEVFNTTNFRDFYNPNEAAQMSRTFQFEQDNYYYIQAIHLSGNPDHMTVGVIVPNNGPRQYNSLRKVMSVKINANVVMQQITFRLKKNVLGLLYQFGARQGTSPTVVRTATFAYPGTSATVESLWTSLGYPVKVVNRTLFSATGAVVTTDALSTYVNYTVIFQNYSSFSSTNKPSGFPIGYLDVYLDNTPTALLTGVFSLSLLGQTFAVSYDQTAESLRYILQSLTGVSMPRVTRYGIPQTGCEWIIQFDGNEEDLPSLTVASQGNLTGGSTGSLSLSVQVIQSSNSSDLLFSPIPYNMLFTAEDKPQITVKARGFPASCPSWECDYSVEEVIVPIIQNFTLDGDILEIYLSDGEALTAADLNVVFADIMAQVISYDPDTQKIIAQIPLNDAGTPLIVAGVHIPTVIVDSVQILDTAPEVTGVLVEPTIGSVDVITSGISDGYIAFDVHGSGYGYYQPDPYNTFVTVGGQECYIVTLTNSETLCFIDSITYNGTVNLTVNGLWATYELNVTQPSEPELPFEIISHTVDTSSAESTFVIQGNDFDNTTGITLSNQDTGELVICNVCSFNSTIITCLTSAIPPGNYTLVATTHVPPTDIIQETTYIDLPLEIYSVVPDAGSQMGGTILTITGKGFSNIVNDNQVSYGHMNYQCNVIDANDTVITCETSANIYDCEETEFQNVTVLQRLEYIAECKGNCTFRYLNDYTPTIYNVSHTEVLAGDSLTITGKNFTSETQIKISGVLATVLTVQSDEITIQVPSIEAGQGLQVTGYDPTFGNFIYVHDILVNHTLKATDFSPKNGSLAGSVLTIDGKGFSALATVTVGATTCQVLSVTPSTLTCKTAANAQGPVVVTQGDYTETITTDNFTSTESYTPSITSISGLPISAAATEIILTLEGQFLDIDTPITVSLVSDLLSYQGQVVSSNTTNVQVKFVNVSAGTYTLSAQVGAHIARFTSVSTTVDVPLNVNTVTPVVSSLAGGVQLEITGTGFSTQSSAQSVTVEGFPCSVVSASFDNIICTVPPFISQATQSTYNFGQEALLSGTYFSNGANENVSKAFDNTTLTYFIPNSANSNCAFGIDFGEGIIAQFTQIQYFPKANIDYTRLSGSLIEASVDGITYVTISQLGTNVYDGWNTITSPMTGQSAVGFRYLRFRKNTASSNCEIAELKVRGILLSALQVNDTTSVQATAKLTVNGKSVSLPSAVEYRADKTPVITAVNPKVGSGKDNTLITLSGTDLDQVNQVQIDNIICNIQSVTSTEVTCITGSLPPVSERRERVQGLINAYTPQGKVSADGVNFLYAEKWSDRDTWGCGGFPKEYDSIHVEVGMNLLIDVSPPKLVAVVVEGALIFDDADIQFTAEYILVRNGFLQIGTESEPIQSNIDITLYGARADAQLPIFGNKVIAVYEGVVDIHGAPRVISTTLAANVDTNQTQIQVTDPVDWRVGEKIAISSTSSDSSQTEERLIIRLIINIISTTIELDQPLNYAHTVTQATINGNNYQTTCEVILLSRNIQIKGDDYSSDQNGYGAHMMFYDPGTESTIIRISYTEITKAGQAGYLGRFPINFQHAGNQMSSYLKGNSIHHTYQRGIQLQGTHYLTVQQNVVYQARGYGINLENGIERFNVFEDNIVLSCQSVLQYLSTQESPAGFRISNPTNFFRRNKAISNPTLGFWFDLQSSTSGAYSSNSICPNGERLGAFEDNIATWNGDDGIRLDTYIPRTYPCRQVQYTNQVDPFANNAPITAVFKNSVVFGNADNGVEAYTVGAVVFDGLIAFENGVAGIDISFSQAPINGTQIINSVFIGSFTPATSTADYKGIRLARSEGLYIQNCTFANFAATKPALEIDSRYYYNYYYDSGARTVFLTQLTFINVTRRVQFYNAATHILIDLDGSLTELTNGGTIVNNLPHLTNLTGCTVNQTFFNGLVCDTNTVFRRVVFYSLNPSTIYGRNLQVLRLYDTLDETNRSSIEYTALPYRYGRNPDASYALPFALGHSYKVFFDGQTDFVSMVFDLSPHWSSSDPAIDFVFNHTAPREDFDVFRWDRIQGTANVENSTELWNVFEPSIVTGKYLGDWYHDVNQSNLFMHVIGGNGTRCKIKGYECRVNCPLPPPGPTMERVIVYWSNHTIWPDQVLPREGDSIVVPWNWTLIMDINPPALDTVEIQGELRFDAGHGENIFIAKKIWVRGLLTIGSESGAFAEKATIILTGTRNEDGLLINGITEAGTKVIGVSGQIAIYGQVVTEKVSLVETLYPSTRFIKTSGNLIGWEVGHHIAVTTTEKDAVYEVFEIESISGSDITVTTAAQYLHYSGVFTNTVDGLTHNIDFSSEVILLNRSVTIQGSREDNWGGRLIVTEEYYDTYTQTGKADLHYVAFDYMGQGFDKSGLSFEYMSNITDNGASIVQSTVMTECLGWGVRFLYSQSISFFSNTILTSRQFGIIFMESNSYVDLVSNNVFNVILDVGVMYTYIEGVSAGLYLNDLAANIVTLSENVIGGCEIAYLIKAVECNVGSPYSSNVAHSSNIGFLMLTDQDKCHEISSLTAYKSDFGVLSYFSAPQIVAHDLLLSDNKVSIHINAVGSDQDQKILTIKDSLFVAFAIKDCPTYYTETSCSFNAAIMLGVATEEGKQLSPRIQDRPWEVINSDASFNSQQIFNNNTFVNFMDSILAQCHNNFVLKTSQYASDYTPYSTVSASHLTDVSINRLAYFDIPVAEQRCGNIPCTGLKNVIIKDADGTLTGNRGSIVPDNAGVIKQNLCNYVSDSNGCICTDESLAILEFESLDIDKNTRVISPVYITNTNGFSNTLNAFKAHDFSGDYTSFHRLARFPSIIQINNNYNIEFSGTLPNALQFAIEGAQSTDYTILKINYYDPQVITVYNAISNTMIHPVPYQFAIDAAIATTDPCGTNYFDRTEKTINFLLTADPACKLAIMKTNVLAINVRYDMIEEEFWQQGGSARFIDKVASVLNISHSTIRVISISKGSVILAVEIVSGYQGVSQTSAAAAELNGFGDKLQAAYAAGDLNVYDNAKILNFSQQTNLITDGTQSADTPQTITQGHTFIIAAAVSACVIVAVLGGFCVYKYNIRRRQAKKALKVVPENKDPEKFKNQFKQLPLESCRAATTGFVFDTSPERRFDTPAQMSTRRMDSQEIMFGKNPTSLGELSVQTRRINKPLSIVFGSTMNLDEFIVSPSQRQTRARLVARRTKNNPAFDEDMEKVEM